MYKPNYYPHYYPSIKKKEPSENKKELQKCSLKLVRNPVDAWKETKGEKPLRDMRVGIKY